MAKYINVELGIDDDSCNEEGDANICTGEDNLNLVETPVIENSIDSCRLDLNIAASDKEVLDQSPERRRVDSCSFSDSSNDQFETQSIRSTATTIHPDEIKRRVQQQIHKKSVKQNRKKCVAKGEASAVTRNRRENVHTIKQSGGIWGWE